MDDKSLEVLGAVPMVVLAEKLMPEILHKGVYTLWRKPDGTLRVQYRRDDREEDDFFEIPGSIIMFVESAQKGKMNPAEFMKASMVFMREMM